MGQMEVKSVSSIQDDDHHTFDMYYKTPDGDWFKTMSITSVRNDKKKQRKY